MKKIALTLVALSRTVWRLRSLPSAGYDLRDTPSNYQRHAVESKASPHRQRRPVISNFDRLNATADENLQGGR